MLDAKVGEVENLEGEAAEQYIEGFNKAIKQVKFLYSDLDVSSCGYFKEDCDGKLVDKPLPGANEAEVEAEDQTKALEDATNLTS